LIDLVIRSASLFARERSLHHFSSSEDEAYVWLEEARRTLLSRLAAA
jgi:hypothetical protein